MKQIPVEFEFEGIKYSHVLEVKDGDEESDFWDVFYNEKNGKELNFDVNYSAEYNSIAVYPIDMETLETDHTTIIVSQPIFTEKEYFEMYPQDDREWHLKHFAFKAE